jgi:hypothetical protein
MNEERVEGKRKQKYSVDTSLDREGGNEGAWVFMGSGVLRRRVG